MAKIANACGITFLILLILITAAATSTKYWVHWLALTIVLAMSLLVNLVFMDEASFVFDPFKKV
eukprot:NODE_6945_length_472_cov_177.395683.p4 GENE.NODE_6945_length_472_cov_177.395683~~NODE_6945_length_472_cov_177.395683.p4  ORF type:complete len:64 (-),score=22.83 NODE_6945_length_472_cov_177.395683:190-381(-)